MPIDESPAQPPPAVLPVEPGSPAAEAWARTRRFKGSTPESRRAARAARRDAKGGLRSDDVPGAAS